MKTKKCTSCKEFKLTSEVKEESMFHFNGWNVDGTRRFVSKCKPCHTVSNRGYEADRKRKIYEVRAEKYNQCENCGMVGWRRMTFHHPNGDKTGNPSDLTKGGLTKWQSEVDKCMVLCAGCHNELHFNERRPDLVGVL